MGPYEICHAISQESSDGCLYKPLSWGYRTAADAYSRLAECAAKAGVPAVECTVIRIIDKEDASDFDQ